VCGKPLAERELNVAVMGFLKKNLFSTFAPHINPLWARRNWRMKDDAIRITKGLENYLFL